MEAAEIHTLFAGRLRSLFQRVPFDKRQIYEIHVRIGRPLFLVGEQGEEVLQEPGMQPYSVTKEDLRETLDYMAGYSIYAYEDEMRQGFLSMRGGHRVGIAGKVILEGGRIRAMKSVSSINVRLAHERKGCADDVMPYVQSERGVAHTLLVSPPGCGKTTLLRDIIRQLSDGREEYPGITVGVVDERSELAGCYEGVPQNDVGARTDVLDGCPKAEGMQMLLRAMAPDVIAADELGKEEDFRAVEAVIHCGCRLIATAHGNSLEELWRQPFFQRLMEMQVFERYIFLGRRGRAGRIEGIYDGLGMPLLEYHS